MLYTGRGDRETQAQVQERNFKRAKTKLDNKIGAIKFLIEDAKISEFQRDRLKKYVSERLKFNQP